MLICFPTYSNMAIWNWYTTQYWKPLNTIYCIPVCVLGITWTLPITSVAIMSFRTQSDITGLPSVSWLTQTLSIGVVALAVILTATCLCTASTISTNWTLILAPVHSKTHSVIHSQWLERSRLSSIFIVSVNAATSPTLKTDWKPVLHTNQTLHKNL